MDNKGVLICGEIAGGKLAPVTIELLGIGRKLADDLGEELSILLMGSNAGSLGQDAIAYGADVVYTADDAQLDDYNSDAYTQVTANLCKKVFPSIMLFGHTDIGCDLSPRLNGRLGGSLAIECSALAIDPATKFLVATRPVFGGNAFAAMVSKSARPQMATMRAKVSPPAERNDGRQGKVVPVEDKLDASALKVKVVEKIKEEVTGVKLVDAEVVVAGGKGMGNAADFAKLRELADIFGGAVGGTRVA